MVVEITIGYVVQIGGRVMRTGHVSTLDRFCCSSIDWAREAVAPSETYIATLYFRTNVPMGIHDDFQAFLGVLKVAHGHDQPWSHRRLALFPPGSNRHRLVLG